MRTRFREWYAPTEETLRRLWERGTVVFDANVLLGLYQYPAAALEEFFKVVDAMRTRVWLPYHAGVEYHRTREMSLPQQRTILERLVRTTEEQAGHLDRLGLPEYHPVLSASAVEVRRTAVKEAYDALLAELRGALAATPEFNAAHILGPEPIRDRLTKLFDGRIGEPLPRAELERLYKEGKERYERDVPPGYKDKAKDEPGRYGDWVIWSELLAYCHALPDGSRDAIFVTNDRKEDWWLRKDEDLLGPRPEIVRELIERVGGEFFMYSPAEFLRAAPTFLNLSVSETSVADVSRVTVTSPIGAILRFQRMILPTAQARVHALAKVYDAVVSGRIQRASDITPTVESLGGDLVHSYVTTPLFFGLVNESYGTILPEPDPTRRLRDRDVRLRDPDIAKDAFIKSGHAGWLAQALFRLRHERVSDEVLLVALFGDDYAEDAPSLLANAKALAERDATYRGVA